MFPLMPRNESINSKQIWDQAFQLKYRPSEKSVPTMAHSFHSLILFFRKVCFAEITMSERIFVSVGSQSATISESQLFSKGLPALVSRQSNSSAEQSKAFKMEMNTSRLGTVEPDSMWLMWLGPTPIASDNFSWVRPFSIRCCFIR